MLRKALIREVYFQSDTPVFFNCFQFQSSQKVFCFLKKKKNVKKEKTTAILGLVYVRVKMHLPPALGLLQWEEMVQRGGSHVQMC